MEHIKVLGAQHPGALEQKYDAFCRAINKQLDQGASACVKDVQYRVVGDASPKYYTLMIRYETDDAGSTFADQGSKGRRTARAWFKRNRW